MNGVEGNDIEVRVMSTISGHGNAVQLMMANKGDCRRQITEKLNKLLEKLS